jgi:hypothetical protein
MHGGNQKEKRGLKAVHERLNTLCGKNIAMNLSVEMCSFFVTWNAWPNHLFNYKFHLNLFIQLGFSLFA